MPDEFTGSETISIYEGNQKIKTERVHTNYFSTYEAFEAYTREWVKSNRVRFPRATKMEFRVYRDGETIPHWQKTVNTAELNDAGGNR